MPESKRNPLPIVNGQPPPEYMAWRLIRDRIENPRNPSYHLFGGAGKVLHEPWVDFEAFLADVGPRPSDRHTLELVDAAGSFVPWNVHWKKMPDKPTAKPRRKPEKLPALLTAGEVAQTLKVEASTVYRWARDGVVPSVRVGGTVRIPADALDALSTTVDAGRRWRRESPVDLLEPPGGDATS